MRDRLIPQLTRMPSPEKRVPREVIGSAVRRQSAILRGSMYIAIVLPSTATVFSDLAREKHRIKNSYQH